MSAISAGFGKLDLSAIATEAWIRVPQPLHFGIRFEVGPIITITVLSFFALVELMGDQASAAMLAQNRLPSDRETRGGILAQGISSVISSAFNMVPTISGSANIGLCGISGVTSRFITAIARCGCRVVRLMPKALRCFFRNPGACPWRRCADCLWHDTCIRHERHQGKRIGCSHYNGCRHFTGGRGRIQYGCRCPFGLSFLGFIHPQRRAGNGDHRSGFKSAVEGKEDGRICIRNDLGRRKFI